MMCTVRRSVASSLGLPMRDFPTTAQCRMPELQVRTCASPWARPPLQLRGFECRARPLRFKGLRPPYGRLLSMNQIRFFSHEREAAIAVVSPTGFEHEQARMDDRVSLDDRLAGGLELRHRLATRRSGRPDAAGILARRPPFDR